MNQLRSSELLPLGYDVDFNQISDCHGVCSLLLKFLQMLPEPVTTYERYDTFIAIQRTSPNTNIALAHFLRQWSGSRGVQTRN